MIYQREDGKVRVSCDCCGTAEIFEHPGIEAGVTGGGEAFEIQVTLAKNREVIEKTLLDDGWMVSREFQKQLCPKCVAQGMTFSKTKDSTGFASFLSMYGRELMLPVHPNESEIVQVRHAGENRKYIYKKMHRAWFQVPSEGGLIEVPSQIPKDFTDAEVEESDYQRNDDLDENALDEIERLFDAD